MDYLNIALVVLAVVGIWAVVEVALTMRSARKDINEVVSSANEVISQAQPIVAKLDGMVDELEPAVKQVTPIMAKTSTALDGANASLQNMGHILSDVSTVSGAAAGVTQTVNGAVAGAASTVANAVKKVTGRSESAPALSGAKKDEPGVTIPEREAAPAPRKPAAYVVYGDAPKAAEPKAADDEKTAEPKADEAPAAAQAADSAADAE